MVAARFHSLLAIRCSPLGPKRGIRTCAHCFAAVLITSVLAAGAQAMTYDEKLATCLACHGEKGISETSEVPSLAGQPADFTLIQLFLFRQNTRKIEIMNDLAKDMTDDDLRKFSRLFRQAAAAEGDSAIRPIRNRRACARRDRQEPLCLLPQSGFLRPRADAAARGAARGLSAEGIARLQGAKRPGYDATMDEVIRPVTDADIVDLSHYLARLR